MNKKLDKELYHLGIYEYSLNKNKELIVSGNVNIKTKWEKIPYKFSSVDGSFSVKGTGLKTLKNSPMVVNGAFDCSYNSLESLKGAPNHVLVLNAASNYDLSSIEHAPYSSSSFFDNTKIPYEDIEIYRTCCRYGTWEQSLSLYENLRLLIQRVPGVSNVQSWKLLKKRDLRGTLLAANVGI